MKIAGKQRVTINEVMAIGHSCVICMSEGLNSVYT